VPKNTLFSLEQRLTHLRELLSGVRDVEIKSFSNVLVEYARENKSRIIIRGLRAVSDFEYEFQMALMNKKMIPEIETFFMMPDEAFTYVSSRNIKDIIQVGGDVTKFVPKVIQKALAERG